MLLLLGGATLYVLFATAVLLRVARQWVLMRAADVLCGVQLVTLVTHAVGFACRVMPVVAAGFVTLCVDRGLRAELASRR